MNKKSKAPLAIGVVVAVLVVAGIIIFASAGKSGDTMKMGSTSPSPAASAAVASNAVTVQNYAFSPAAVTVKVGTTVTWTNQDAVGHTITVDSGDGPTSALFARGQTFSYTFSKTGTFTYHCTPHPYMKGSVIVTN